MDQSTASPIIPNATDFTKQGLRRFKPYPEYKDSGVEWLGKIPVHWEVKPIRSLARRGYKTFTDGDWIESPFICDEGIRLIQTGNVGIGEYKEQGFRYIDEETFRALRCTEVLPGDILICRLADPVGRACLAPNLGSRMITSVDVCILKPSDEVNAQFLVYALSGDAYLAWLDGICRGGTRDRVSRSMLGAIRVQIPPFSEQQAITSFLNRETAKIDALISKKEKLIELLKEKRTALISQAVTKGLNPNVPMKDSGIEWLGKIPAHWKIIPLKYCAAKKPNAIKTGPFGSQLLSSEMMSGEVKVYNQRTVLDHDFMSGDNYITQDKFKDLVSFAVEPGDILLTTRGTIGRCAIVPKNAEPGILHPCLMRIQTDQSIVFPEYLVLLIQDSFLVQTQTKIASNATTIDVIYSETMKEIKIPLPPVQEQIVIIAAVNRETAKIDALISKIREAIDHLKEYRTALISAAVTGKIDVRNMVGARHAVPLQELDDANKQPNRTR